MERRKDFDLLVALQEKTGDQLLSCKCFILNYERLKFSQCIRVTKGVEPYWVCAVFLLFVVCRLSSNSRELELARNLKLDWMIGNDVHQRLLKYEPSQPDGGAVIKAWKWSLRYASVAFIAPPIGWAQRALVGRFPVPLCTYPPSFVMMGQRVWELWPIISKPCPLQKYICLLIPWHHILKRYW